MESKSSKRKQQTQEVVPSTTTKKQKTEVNLDDETTKSRYAVFISSVLKNNSPPASLDVLHDQLKTINKEIKSCSPKTDERTVRVLTWKAGLVKCQLKQLCDLITTQSRDVAINAVRARFVGFRALAARSESCGELQWSQWLARLDQKRANIEPSIPISVSQSDFPSSSKTPLICLRYYANVLINGVSSFERFHEMVSVVQIDESFVSPTESAVIVVKTSSGALISLSGPRACSYEEESGAMKGRLLFHPRTSHPNCPRDKWGTNECTRWHSVGKHEKFPDSCQFTLCTSLTERYYMQLSHLLKMLDRVLPRDLILIIWRKCEMYISNDYAILTLEQQENNDLCCRRDLTPEARGCAKWSVQNEKYNGGGWFTFF